MRVAVISLLAMFLAVLPEAEQGNSKAQYLFGAMYQAGEGVFKNDKTDI